MLERMKGVWDPDVVEDLYSIAQKHLDEEAARTGKLDAKATTLLGATGLLTTIAFSFGPAVFFGQPGHLHGVVGAIIFVLFLLLIAYGVLAANYAVSSLRTRETFVVSSEETLLREDALAYAQAWGRAAYRKYLIAHMLPIAAKNKDINDEKASLVGSAQDCLKMFLRIAVALSLLIAVLGLQAAETYRTQPPRGRGGATVTP